MIVPAVPKPRREPKPDRAWNSTLRVRTAGLAPTGSLRRTPFKAVGWQSVPTGTRRNDLGASKRIAVRSKKRAKDERTYVRRRLAWLVENPFCAACGKPTEDLHHSGGRDGWRLLFEPWWVPLCRRHHDWCGRFPEAAIAAGYSRRRHDKPTGDAA